MTRRMLAIGLILARNMGVATDVTPPNWGILLTKLWKEWETPVLVLLSLTLQVILMLFGDQRRRTRSNVIRFIIWSAYMAADSVAIFALGVISNNLHEALINGGSLGASIELASFWAPFLLLHLGGQDTITAYSLQDNELWLRHLLYLIVETGIVIYILVRAPNGSRLSIPSSMMLGAGFIKYAERTLSLWFASYNWRRSQAVLDNTWSTYSDFSFARWDRNVENELLDEELLAAKMFRMTERMFADAVIQDDGKSSAKKIVRTKSSSMVSKLITMELELMYENLYTKSKVTHSWWGLALRLISFLLILSTLISFSFSCLHHRHNYSTFQLFVTFVLLGVAILLEGYAAFVFLTSGWTISWFREHHMDTASPAVKFLKSIRRPGWSNSMGQLSMINSAVRPKPAIALLSKVISTLYRIIVVFIMRKPGLICYVYERPVKDYVKEGILEYLKQAEAKYKGGPFSILNSRGRIPWATWKEEYRNHRHATGLEVGPTATGHEVDTTATGLNFDDMGFGDMVILWHFVSEVCYYFDYDSIIGWKGETFPPKVYQDWKMSKYLSRYLMQLYLDSSDMLPPRGPLSENKFFNFYQNYLFVRASRIDVTGKQGRKREKVQQVRDYLSENLKAESPNWNNPTVADGHNLMEALLIEEYPQSNSSKLDLKWKLLNDVWIELLVSAASQCKGNQHAQHLSQGGELLTYVWVLLNHLALIEPY